MLFSDLIYRHIFSQVKRIELLDGRSLYDDIEEQYDDDGDDSDDDDSPNVREVSS